MSKASEMLAECIIDMVHEYKHQAETLNRRIDGLYAENKEMQNKLNRAVEQADNATDTLGEIAEIIAEITEHDEAGYINIYLSDVITENAIKLKRLFALLDIPMTAEQIKDGDINED